MNKIDLKSGYLVETVDNCIFLYIETIIGKFLLFDSLNVINIDKFYNDNLTRIEENFSPKFDIVRVYEIFDESLYHSDDKFQNFQFHRNMNDMFEDKNDSFRLLWEKEGYERKKMMNNEENITNTLLDEFSSISKNIDNI